MLGGGEEGDAPSIEVSGFNLYNVSFHVFFMSHSDNMRSWNYP